CRLIDGGARVIISLTSCSLAEYTALTTSQHHVVHLAIPHPMCAHRPVDGEFLTLWFQPELDAMARFLFQITTIEREARTLLLSNNGPTGEVIPFSLEGLLKNYYVELIPKPHGTPCFSKSSFSAISRIFAPYFAVIPNRLRVLSGKAILEKSKLLPVYFTQEFNTEKDRQLDKERRYFRPLLDEVFTFLEHRNAENKSKTNVGQIFMFTPLGDEVAMLNKASYICTMCFYFSFCIFIPIYPYLDRTGGLHTRNRFSSPAMKQHVSAEFSL
ncbi:hypothetical protein D915_002937, partial [Fasciola hepatica]